MLLQCKSRLLVGRCLPRLSPHRPLGGRQRSSAGGQTPGDKKSEDEQWVDKDWIYSKEKDPMANMTEEEKNRIRQHVREDSRRAFSTAYGILGGSMVVVGAIALYQYSTSPRRHG